MSPPTPSPGAGIGGYPGHPSAVGSSGNDAYGCPTAAVWITPPFQEVTDTLDLVVNAYHPTGIQRVDFAINGGDAESVTTPTDFTARFARDASGDEFVYRDYVMRVDASLLSAGEFHATAIAYPNHGLPFYAVQRTRWFWVGYASHSSDPMTARPTYVVGDGGDFADIESAITDLKNEGELEGSRLQLMAGTHSFDIAVGGTTVGRRCVIERHSSAAFGEVILGASVDEGLNLKGGNGNRFQVDGMHVRGNLQGENTGDVNNHSSLWVTNSRFVSSDDRSDHTGFRRWNDGKYITNCTADEIRLQHGIEHCDGFYADGIGQDAMKDGWCIRDFRIGIMNRPEGAGWHDDGGERFGISSMGLIHYIDGLECEDARTESWTGGPYANEIQAILRFNVNQPDGGKGIVFGYDPTGAMDSETAVRNTERTNSDDRDGDWLAVGLVSGYGNVMVSGNRLVGPNCALVTDDPERAFGDEGATHFWQYRNNDFETGAVLYRSEDPDEHPRVADGTVYTTFFTGDDPNFSESEGGGGGEEPSSGGQYVVLNVVSGYLVLQVEEG